MCNQSYLSYFPTGMKNKTTIGLGKIQIINITSLLMANRYINEETVSAFKVTNVMKNFGK